MKVFLMSIIGHVLMSAYLIYKLRQTQFRGRIAGKLIEAGVVIYLISFLLVYFLRGRFSFSEMEAVLRFYNNVYVAAIMYCFGLFIVGFATRMFLYVRRKRKLPLQAEDIHRWYGYVMLTGLLLLVLACNKGYHNTMNPIVSEYKVHIDKPLEGERTDKHIKICLITDTHIGEIMGVEQMKHLVDMVEAQKPDLILVGGDILDYSSAYTHNPAYTNVMRQLKCPLGTYYVLGNHEYREDTAQKIAWISSIGTLLRDSVVTLPETNISLIGRDDYTNRDRASIQALCQRFHVKASNPIIVLDHQPRLKGEEEQNHIDLGLYGHTHGGQFVPFNCLVRLRYPLIHGLKTDGTFNAVVSSGYGVAGSPFRFGTHSEIVIIDLNFD